MQRSFSIFWLLVKAHLVHAFSRQWWGDIIKLGDITLSKLKVWGRTHRVHLKKHTDARPHACTSALQTRASVYHDEWLRGVSFWRGLHSFVSGGFWGRVKQLFYTESKQTLKTLILERVQPFVAESHIHPKIWLFSGIFHCTMRMNKSHASSHCLLFSTCNWNFWLTFDFFFF